LADLHVSVLAMIHGFLPRSKDRAAFRATCRCFSSVKPLAFDKHATSLARALAAQKSGHIIDRDCLWGVSVEISITTTKRYMITRSVNTWGPLFEVILVDTNNRHNLEDIYNVTCPASADSPCAMVLRLADRTRIQQRHRNEFYCVQASQPWCTVRCTVWDRHNGSAAPQWVIPKVCSNRGVAFQDGAWKTCFTFAHGLRKLNTLTDD
jgi:hypothetical protein